MTTIILDQRVKTVYADRKVTYGTGPHGVGTKIHPFKFKGGTKAILVESGTVDDTRTLLHHLKNCKDVDAIFKLPRKVREQERKVNTILIDAKSKRAYTIGKSLVPILIEDPYWAEGAGWEMALCLLDAGVPVPRVYEIISRRTGHTSMDFDSASY